MNMLVSLCIVVLAVSNIYTVHVNENTLTSNKIECRVNGLIAALLPKCEIPSNGLSTSAKTNMG